MEKKASLMFIGYNMSMKPFKFAGDENSEAIDTLKDKTSSIAATQNKISANTSILKHDQQIIKSGALSLIKCANSTSYSAKKAASTSRSAAVDVKKLCNLIPPLTTQVENNTKAIHALEKQVADLPIPQDSFTEEDRQRQVKLEKEVDEIKNLLAQLVKQQSKQPATMEVVINTTTSKGEKVDAAVLDMVNEAVNKAVAQIYEDSAEKVLEMDDTTKADDVPPAGVEGETEKKENVEIPPAGVEGEIEKDGNDEAPPAGIEGEQQIVMFNAPPAAVEGHIEAFGDLEEQFDPETVKASWEARFAEEMARDRSSEMLPVFHRRYMTNAEIPHFLMNGEDNSPSLGSSRNLPLLSNLSNPQQVISMK